VLAASITDGVLAGLVAERRPQWFEGWRVFVTSIGIQAIHLVVVGVGLLLWFGEGKPAEYYSSNWIFHLKLGLFTAMAILSIWPTVFFFRHRKGEESEWIEIPARIRLMIRLELVLLLFIPLCATLMARGFGQMGA